MVRVPLANERSARIEVRTVAPDANPYFALFMITRAGIRAMFGTDKAKANYGKIRDEKPKVLPATIQEAIEAFEASQYIREVLANGNREKFIAIKKEVASRSPAQLGTTVKNWEVWDHHEVTNQVLKNKF